MGRVLGVRGATTADENTKEAILVATRELLECLVEENDIQVGDVAAAYFTTTDDLDAEFPAQAARHLGWEYVALMCGREIAVPDAPTRCIRILLLLNTDVQHEDLTFVYLKGAKNLRDRGTEKS